MYSKICRQLSGGENGNGSVFRIPDCAASAQLQVRPLLLFTRHYSARCFRTFCAEIPSFSARNRIFLRFLCIAKRVAGHGVNSNHVQAVKVIIWNKGFTPCLRIVIINIQKQVQMLFLK